MASQVAFPSTVALFKDSKDEDSSKDPSDLTHVYGEARSTGASGSRIPRNNEVTASAAIGSQPSSETPPRATSPPAVPQSSGQLKLQLPSEPEDSETDSDIYIRKDREGSKNLLSSITLSPFTECFGKRRTALDTQPLSEGDLAEARAMSSSANSSPGGSEGNLKIEGSPSQNTVTVSSPAHIESSPSARTDGDGKKRNVLSGLLHSIPVPFRRSESDPHSTGNRRSSATPDDFAVSGPSNFRHTSHVGWDPATGFEAANLPAEWRKLFEAAGIPATELTDLPTSRYIYDTVVTALPTTSAAAASTSAGPSSPAPRLTLSNTNSRSSTAPSSEPASPSTAPQSPAASSSGQRTPSRKELPDLSGLAPEAQQQLADTLSIAMQKRPLPLPPTQDSQKKIDEGAQPSSSV